MVTVYDPASIHPHQWENDGYVEVALNRGGVWRFSGECFGPPPSWEQIAAAFESRLVLSYRVGLRGERLVDLHSEDAARVIAAQRQFRTGEIVEAFRRVIREERGE